MQDDTFLIEYLGKLPADYWDFRDSDTKEFTHGIHNYPAMMVPPISRNIIAVMKKIKPINSLFDPFVGSGTVLVEGMLANIPVIAGNDINPLALFLTGAKTTIIARDRLTKTAEAFRKSLSCIFDRYCLIIDAVDFHIESLGLDITAKDGWGEHAPELLRRYCKENGIDVVLPDFKNIGYWFKPKVIISLALIKQEILKVTDHDIRNFFFVAFSEVIRLVSNRRNGEFKMFRMPVEKVHRFDPDVEHEFLRILDRNIAKMHEFEEKLADIRELSAVSIYADNACDLSDVPDAAYDLVITSPPYGDSRTTVAYGEFGRLSLQWIDLFDLSQEDIMRIDRSLMGGEKFKKGFASELKSPTLSASLERIAACDMERAGDVYSFYRDLASAIKEIGKKTKRGGYQFWVVGNRTVKTEVLQTDVIITELADAGGLKWIHTIDRNIPNKVMPSLNSPSNEAGKKASTMTMEHIVILKKE